MHTETKPAHIRHLWENSRSDFEWVGGGGPVACLA